MNDFEDHYIEWKAPDIKEYIYSDSICIQF